MAAKTKFFCTCHVIFLITFAQTFFHMLAHVHEDFFFFNFALCRQVLTRPWAIYLLKLVGQVHYFF